MGIQKTASDVLLSRVWLVGGFCTSLYGIIQILTAISDFVAGWYDFGVFIATVGVVYILVGILMIYGTASRKRVQSWFMSRGENAATAAGVAELLGGRRVDEVLERARDKFAYIQADQILLEDMQDNTPNPKLGALTTKGHIGFVDAFVSHSWHDDCIRKWEALQDFRNAFKLKHNRE